MAQIAADAVLDAVYLVEVTVQQPGGVSTSGDADFGARMFGDGLQPDQIAVGELVLRFSSDEYATLPDDTPASLLYEPRAAVALDLARSVPISPGAAGIVALQVGEIELVNSDGALDPIVNAYPVDGRDVVVKKVKRGAAYATAVTVFKGTASGWLYGDRTRAKLAVHGISYLLEQPAQVNTYAGSGGQEGGADIKGLRKPINYGPIGRFTPPCVDTVKLIYQINDGPVDGGCVGRDGDAASITLGDDYADYASLAAASTAAGEMDTCLAEGFVRLGSKPNFNFTVDFRGDKSGGVYRTVTADIGRHMLEQRLGFGTSRTDAAAFDALATLQPAPVAYSLNTDVKTASAVLAELFGGIGAFVADTIDGTFTCARLDRPAVLPSLEIPAEAVADPGLQPIALPDDINPCIWRISCAWGRNWTLQTANLAASVLADLDRVNYLARPYRLAPSAQPSRLQSYPTAQDHAEVQSFFDAAEDAEDEADRLIDLHKPGGQTFGVPLNGCDLNGELGMTYRQYYDRFGMADGPGVAVFEQRLTADGKALSYSVLK